ncbi:hypothetical protein H206_05131 [Candidatus Electrothrix aarhusensis]|uniref:Uncharacterized protein n=1 Tax=Candidatus Electrothrix aarhusensis TaxID=1859131 RepID=A0A3S3R247_9BACT|nr:hypothetical protein H206_05131 [Candidatus Electrothrix aarhusensis]
MQNRLLTLHSLVMRYKRICSSSCNEGTGVYFLREHNERTSSWLNF